MFNVRVHSVGNPTQFGFLRKQCQPEAVVSHCAMSFLVVKCSCQWPLLPFVGSLMQMLKRLGRSVLTTVSTGLEASEV